ncbi:MAG TPA: acyltransferase family protein [Pseudolysinimonas sp.]|nr:acyltransferase family protein [Pseudolysinimonas sp.]
MKPQTPHTVPALETASSSTPFRVVGLDGVRAIAVVLVILFHLTPGAVVGGFLGVDLFFVVSGFLITSLLLRERAATGRISLSAFWRRRARRLLPALGVLLLVCCTAAYAIGGDILVGVRQQLAGAVTFSSNWLFLAGSSDYFDASVPELFRNLWSLAVEEQFYLLWPLLLVLVLLRVPRWVRIAGVSLLAVGSAVWMAVLWSADNATRVYYGTDTHFFGLAIGAVLAFVAASWPARALEWPRALRVILGVTGPVALAGILAIAAVLNEDSAAPFQGGLALVSVLSAVVLATLLVPGTLLGRVLDWAPLRWIGQRSYGLYLWHWPVFLLLVAGLPGWTRDGWQGWVLGGVALVITVTAAAVSYELVEQPIRRHGFRATGAAFAGWFSGRAQHSFLAGVWVVVLLLSAGIGTVGAVAADPGRGETELLVAAGQQALDEAAAHEATATPDPTDTPGADPAPDADAPPKPVGGDQITAIGDSVMLAAAPTLYAKFPGIYVDAQVSRSIYVAPDIIQRLIDTGQLRQVLVVALGTNGPIDRGVLDRIREMAGPDRLLVVVNVQAPRTWSAGVNSTLSAFALDYRNVELANWHDTIQPSLSVLAGDQIHFGEAGATIFSKTISDALQRLAELPPLRDDRANQSLPQPV